MAKPIPILFRRNDKTLGIANGDFGTITHIKHDRVHVKMVDHREIHFSMKDYHEFQYGYAATIHKAQGATFDRVFVYAGGNGWNRHLAYVALTRHRKQVELHADHETYRSKADLDKYFSRHQIKDNALDWPINFATHRGFDPAAILGRLFDKIVGLKQSLNKKQQPQSPEKIKRNNLVNSKDSEQLEWEQLKTISSPSVQRVLLAKSRLDNAKTNLNKTIQQREFNKAVNSLAKNPNAMKKVQAIAPNLTKQIIAISNQQSIERGINRN